MNDDKSTTRDLVEGARGPRTRWSIRAGMAFVTLVVVAGAVGLAGPRTGTTAASGGGYELNVEYPSISRAGQPAPLRLTVTHAGGFDAPVQVALCDELFDDLDFQNWYPNPSAEVGEPDAMVYEFDPPTGDVLEVSLDARSAPGQFGEVEGCHVAVLVDDVPATAVTFDSWRLP